MSYIRPFSFVQSSILWLILLLLYGKIWKWHKIVASKCCSYKLNATARMKKENSCYRSCAHGKSLLCLQLHADEVKGSIQWKMTLQPRLCVKTTDNSDKSYSRVLPPPKANPLSQIGGRSLLKLQRFGHKLGMWNQITEQ